MASLKCLFCPQVPITASSPCPAGLLTRGKKPSSYWPQRTVASHTFVNIPFIKHSLKFLTSVCYLNPDTTMFPTSFICKILEDVHHKKKKKRKKEGIGTKRKTKIQETEKQSGQRNAHNNSKWSTQDHTAGYGVCEAGLDRISSEDSGKDYLDDGRLKTLNRGELLHICIYFFNWTIIALQYCVSSCCRKI